MITIAISRGRLLNQSVEILARAGFSMPADLGRHLALSLPEQEVKFIFTKDFDTPLYVEYGAADLGICGKDVLLERKKIDTYEIADLGYGNCQITVAGPEKYRNFREFPSIKVATKYPNITSDYFISQEIPFELIKLSGSVELACLSGLAEVIVDIVNTGQTLKENELTILEIICSSSARLIVNRASYALKITEIEESKGRLINASHRKEI